VRARARIGLGYYPTVSAARARRPARERSLTWSAGRREWTSGFKERFGLVYIDYANGQARHPKRSLAWLSRWFGLTSGAAQVSAQSI
jgi:hypothetical protein